MFLCFMIYYRRQSHNIKSITLSIITIYFECQRFPRSIKTGMRAYVKINSRNDSKFPKLQLTNIDINV